MLTHAFSCLEGSAHASSLLVLTSPLVPRDGLPSSHVFHENHSFTRYLRSSLTWLLPHTIIFKLCVYSLDALSWFSLSQHASLKRLRLYLCFYYTPCANPSAGSQGVSDGTIFNLFTFEVSTSKGISIWGWDTLSWKRCCKGVMCSGVQTLLHWGDSPLWISFQEHCGTLRKASVLHEIIKRPTNQIFSVKNGGSSPSFLL